MTRHQKGGEAYGRALRDDRKVRAEGSGARARWDGDGSAAGVQVEGKRGSTGNAATRSSERR
jgi:hypothetical protein